MTSYKELMMELDRLLFTEYRTVCIDSNKTGAIPTNKALNEAMTVNENLLSLGYTLSGEDFIKLSCSDSRYSLWQKVSNFMPSVKAEPMYPNFPNQVIDMDKAVYRMNQMLHYMSTYWTEAVTNNEVLKGWLPDMENTPKVKEDEKLLEAKMLHLIWREEQRHFIIAKIFAQKTRMSAPEERMLSLVLQTTPPEVLLNVLSGQKPKFKENLGIICDVLIDTKELNETRIEYAMKGLMAHSGDVFKALKTVLDRHHWHLKKRQKRIFVHVLESFPGADFENNLILSSKKAQKNKDLLRFIDFNTYSKSTLHRSLVDSLRSGKLRSWESRMKSMMKEAEEGKISQQEVVHFIAKRPGILLRMVAQLLREGYKPELIEEEMLPNASALSGRTLTNVISLMGIRNMPEVRKLMISFLSEKLKDVNTEIAGKKVFVDSGIFDLEQSEIGKAEEGGYLSQGIAIKIPDEVNVLRFFVYWNDDRRVDVDLHVYGEKADRSPIHVGWDADYINNGICHSGDITHSNAAEYIDIDLNRTSAKHLWANIDLFSGAQSFKDIQECYTGLLAVKRLAEDVKLYNPKNCLFSHDLMSKKRYIGYGLIDVENRVLKLSLENGDSYGMERWCGNNHHPNPYPNKGFLSIKEYLSILCESQGCTFVDNKDDAEIVLTVDHQEECVSLIENNFWLDE